MKTVYWRNNLLVLFVFWGFPTSKCYEINLSKNYLVVGLHKSENVTMILNNDYHNESINIEAIWNENYLLVYPKYLEVQPGNASSLKYTFHVNGKQTGVSLIEFKLNNKTISQLTLLTRITIENNLEQVVYCLRLLSYVLLAVSMYPQLYTIRNHNNIVGISMDYVYLNFISRGFTLFYGIQMACTSLKEEYHRSYPKGHIPITVVDNAFAFHGFIASSILCLQANKYYSEHKKLSTIAKGTIFFCMIVPSGTFILEKFSLMHALDVMYIIRYISFAISLTKYIPQVYKNFTRKCTFGWNIFGPIFEMTGCIITVTAILINSYNIGYADFSLNIFESGIIEILVVVILMIYHIVFIIQHVFWHFDQTYYNLEFDQTDQCFCKCEEAQPPYDIPY